MAGGRRDAERVRMGRQTGVEVMKVSMVLVGGGRVCEFEGDGGSSRGFWLLFCVRWFLWT